MSRTMEVVIYQEGDQWVAQALNVDVSSFGDTVDEARAAIQEARAAIQEALELYFEGAGSPFPSGEGGRGVRFC